MQEWINQVLQSPNFHLAGLGVGKLTSAVKRLGPVVQSAAGVILLAVGFLLLAGI